MSNLVYQEINQEIGLIKNNIIKQTLSKYKPVQVIIEDTLNLNGKMLRPKFMILASKFSDSGMDRSKLISMASAIETLHMATLIHDDVVDDADLRRNKKSVQSKYGKDMAVYVGDYLLAKALGMVDDNDFSYEVRRQIPKAIERICESELMQYFNRYNKMSIRNYLRVVSGKTAALFAISMYSGALESGCNEKMAMNLGKIGYEIGIAYQIIDDILDFQTDCEIVGKTTQNDFKNGYYTLPIIYAIENQTVKFEDLNEEWLLECVNSTGALEKSRILARKYTDKAFKRLELLPNNAYKETLKEMMSAMLRRQY